MDDVAYRQAEVRKLLVGARAVGVLMALQHEDDLPHDFRAQVAGIVADWTAAHEAALAALDAPDREAA